MQVKKCVREADNHVSQPVYIKQTENKKNICAPKQSFHLHCVFQFRWFFIFFGTHGQIPLIENKVQHDQEKPVPGGILLNSQTTKKDPTDNSNQDQ